jgi:hypothetical protein
MSCKKSEKVRTWGVPLVTWCSCQPIGWRCPKPVRRKNSTLNFIVAWNWQCHTRSPRGSEFEIKAEYVYVASQLLQVSSRFGGDRALELRVTEVASCEDGRRVSSPEVLSPCCWHSWLNLMRTELYWKWVYPVLGCNIGKCHQPGGGGVEGSGNSSVCPLLQFFF